MSKYDVIILIKASHASEYWQRVYYAKGILYSLIFVFLAASGAHNICRYLFSV